MSYQPLGLAALLVSAIRGAVADPAVQEQVDRQAEEIGAVRSAIDGITSRLGSIEEAATANGQLDEDQTATLSGIKAELADLATALTGPADDPEDNGVLAEVEPTAETTSPAADAIVEQQGEAVEEAAEQGEQQEEQQQEG